MAASGSEICIFPELKTDIIYFLSSFFCHLSKILDFAVNAALSFGRPPARTHRQIAKRCTCGPSRGTRSCPALSFVSDLKTEGRSIGRFSSGFSSTVTPRRNE